MRKFLTKAKEKAINLGCRRLFIVWGLMLNLGLALHQYELFLRAYLSPQKAIAFYINQFGEANGELILMTMAAVIGVSATVCALMAIRSGRYKV
jgi:hypothetical protein